MGAALNRSVQYLTASHNALTVCKLGFAWPKQIAFMCQTFTMS
jgi:hypothetical protein